MKNNDMDYCAIVKTIISSISHDIQDQDHISHNILICIELNMYHTYCIHFIFALGHHQGGQVIMALDLSFLRRQ
jgi:hypothetical protein